MGFNQNRKLYDFYKEKYHEYHGHYPKGSVHRHTWMLNDIVNDIGEEQTHQAIEYYFKFYSEHDFKNFCYNYDEILDRGKRQTADKNRRKAWRARARAKLKELKDEDEL